jgi:signal transduction histidine kinase
MTGAPRSLVSSLVRGAALWAIPALVLAALALTWVSRSSTYRGFDEPLEAAVTGLIASVEVREDGTLRLSRELPDPRYQRALSGRYWVMGILGEGGEILPALSSRSLYGARFYVNDNAEAALAAVTAEPVRFITAGPDVEADETLRVVARQVAFEGVTDPIIVAAAADRQPVIESIRTLVLTMLSLMLLVTIGLVFAVYTQVRLGLRPLFDLRNRIADVREGRAAQVDGSYPPEIAPLAGELNSLIAHNKNIVERAQTHVGNLAHALKTPIAVLRNEAAAGKTTNSDVVSRQTESMSAQVDHHLRRARAAARGQAIGVRADVDPVVDGLVRTLPRIYRERDLIITKSGETGLRFRGHPRDLEDMVGNLMDNAAKWTRGKVEVDIRRSAPSQFTISVRDSGPGLEPEQYDEALKRGARLDEATPGTGLGLSIVSDLAEAYNGSLELGRAKIGGLEAVLRLPAAPDG